MLHLAYWTEVSDTLPRVHDMGAFDTEDWDRPKAVFTASVRRGNRRPQGQSEASSACTATFLSLLSFLFGGGVPKHRQRQAHVIYDPFTVKLKARAKPSQEVHVSSVEFSCKGVLFSSTRS